MANFKPAKLDRHNAEPLGNLLGLFVASNNLAPGLIRKAVFDAWDSASGAAKCTAGRFLKNDVLYITVGSSVVRSHLAFRKSEILAAVNGILAESEVLKTCGLKVEIKDIKLH